MSRKQTIICTYVKLVDHELFNTVKTIKVKTSSNGYSIYVLSHSGPSGKKCNFGKPHCFPQAKIKGFF